MYQESAIESFSINLGNAIFANIDPRPISFSFFPASDGFGGVSSSGRRPIAQARIIVSIRDGSRGELSDLHRLLNSDIDRLSDLIKRADEFIAVGESVPPDIERQILETIEVLRGTWPARKTQIDVAIRKLLAELGLVPII